MSNAHKRELERAKKNRKHEIRLAKLGMLTALIRLTAELVDLIRKLLEKP